MLVIANAGSECKLDGTDQGFVGHLINVKFKIDRPYVIKLK